MRVITVCNWLTEGTREQDDWCCFKFVKAIKGESFSKYADVPVRGRRRRLTPENADDALSWAAELVADQIAREFPNTPIALVPLPGSEHTSIVEVRGGRPYAMATQIVSHLRAGGVDVRRTAALCWDQVMPKSHQGGSRNPRYLLKHMVWTNTSPLEGRTVVLFDDVLTSGAHLRAAKACADEHCTAPVADVGFAVARVIHEPEDVFAVKSTDLPQLGVETEDFEF